MGTNRLSSRRRQDQGSKIGRIVIAILATIGAIDTGAITLEKWGIIGSVCNAAKGSGCDKVLSSQWGTLFSNTNFSQPLSLFGFGAYFMIILLALLPFTQGLKNSLARSSWWLIFMISIGMTAFSITLIELMVNKIEAFCVFCIISAILSFLIFITSIISGGWESRGDLFLRGLVIGLLVLTISFIWSSSKVENIDNLNQSYYLNQGISPPIKTLSSEKSISLSKHLSKEGVSIYKAYWCPHCHEQIELFGKEGASNLNQIECSHDGQNTQRSLCLSKGIGAYPSWEINGEIYEGVKSLKELAELSKYDGPENFN